MISDFLVRMDLRKTAFDCTKGVAIPGMVPVYDQTILVAQRYIASAENFVAVTRIFARQKQL